MTDDEKIALLSANTAKLIEVCNAQKMSIVRLQAALNGQKDLNTRLKLKIEDLESKINAVSIAEGLLDVSGSGKVARARVNNLIKQVDKCISMLNR